MAENANSVHAYDAAVKGIKGMPIGRQRALALDTCWMIKRALRDPEIRKKVDAIIEAKKSNQ